MDYVWDYIAEFWENGKRTSSLTCCGTQYYPSFEAALKDCREDRARMEKEGWKTHSPLIVQANKLN